MKLHYSAFAGAAFFFGADFGFVTGVSLSTGAAGELATQIETLGRESQKLADMGAHLSAALDDSLPLLARDGGFIRSGFHAGLDEARALRDESRRIIAALQNRYGEETGIKALKIKHNGVLGFHIDVPAAHGDKLMRAPHDGVFIHRQTLASSVRFSSAELAELAGQISRAYGLPDGFCCNLLF